ncbi:MAG TPA: response regulator transcription factor [Thermodesulfovibrionales bacterium]|nr:response regulator transcription factor [Thermodesulfovibrionales bacterium]
MFRILIADDHPIVRKGLVHVLEDSGIVRSIEEASNGQEVLDKVKRSRFDVVLLDISMPGMGGIETLEELKKLYPSLPVLMLSMYPEEEFAVRALKAGAAGYLTKKSASDELTGAIRKISRGQRYIGASLAEFLAVNLTEDSERPLHELLSNRELQVLRMIVKGMSIKEIAGEISRSPKTVSTFRSRILEKLKMKSNAQLIQYAMKNNLID